MSPVLPLAHLVQPETSTEIGVRLLSIATLIAINAFFVTAEFSIVSVRRSRINQLIDAGDLQARTVRDLQQGIDRLLSTTQLGITLSSLALGWIGEQVMVDLVASGLVRLPIDRATRTMLAHSCATPIAFLSIAYLQIVLGELCPKSVAMLYAEKIALVLAPFSVAIGRLFNPFIWVLNRSTQLILRLLGIHYSGQGWYNQVTSEELQLMIETSSESIGLEEEERELLSNVFEFGEVSASEVMVRRPSMVAIEIKGTVRDLLEEVSYSNHSRYPVMDGSLDDICGVIHLKELAEPLIQGTLTLDGSIQPWVRPVQFVPQYTSLADLLTLMQASGQHIVIVVDEFGETAGLVTIQDLVTQLIGESPESGDEKALTIQWVDQHSCLVQAQMDIEEVNELLQLNLPLSVEYQTLGGFLLYEWQCIPKEGETLQYGDCELTVVSTEGPRLHQINIHRISPVQERETSEDLLAPPA
ncbi:MAG: HlyC/CorC family transporter [Alkalinema sp. RU_4_3]|nr:HlyC/CorC family transporter [Alkalinema sp. RU_4_3]